MHQDGKKKEHLTNDVALIGRAGGEHQVMGSSPVMVSGWQSYNIKNMTI